jgi:hypothetical protein
MAGFSFASLLVRAFILCRLHFTDLLPLPYANRASKRTTRIGFRALSFRTALAVVALQRRLPWQIPGRVMACVCLFLFPVPRHLELRCRNHCCEGSIL